MNETLRTYSGEAETYRSVTGYTMDDDTKNWLDSTVKDLPSGSRIFEIGSAHGRDALYLRDHYSFDVHCSDAVPEFISMLEEVYLDAVFWDADEHELPESFDLYLANAVLIHLSRERVATLLRDAYLKLPAKGKFAFTLKKGEGSEIISTKLAGPRLFNYWLPHEVVGVAVGAGFRSFELVENETWLICIATKRV